MQTKPAARSKDGKKGKKPKGHSSSEAAARSTNRTASLKARVKPEKTYRIGVMGFSLEQTGKRRGLLEDAFARMFEGHDGPRLALLPGVSGNGKGWPAGTEQVCAAAEAHDVAVLFETMMTLSGKPRGVYTAFDPKKGLLPVEIYQRFVDSGQANREPDVVAGLVKDCGPGGQRTINVAGLPLGLLVCGENNILTNKQTENNRVVVRHQEGADLFDHVRVIFNGAHTPMGNWGKLNRRFEYLSRGGRWAFYATNCDGVTWGRSTLRAYHDGQLIADSQGPVSDRPVRTRRVQDHDARDRFLALTLDVKGQLLA